MHTKHYVNNTGGVASIYTGDPAIISGSMKTGKMNTRMEVAGNLILENFTFSGGGGSRGWVSMHDGDREDHHGALLLRASTKFTDKAEIIFEADVMDLTIPHSSMSRYFGKAIFTGAIIDASGIERYETMPGRPAFEFYASPEHRKASVEPCRTAEKDAPEIQHIQEAPKSSITLGAIPANVPVMGFDTAVITAIYSPRFEPDKPATILCKDIRVGKVENATLGGSMISIGKLRGNLTVESYPSSDEAHVKPLVTIGTIDITSQDSAMEIHAEGCKLVLTHLPRLDIPSSRGYVQKTYPPRLTIHLGKDGELHLPENAPPREIDAFLKNPELSITGGKALGVYGSTIHLPTKGNGISSVAEYVKNKRGSQSPQ